MQHFKASGPADLSAAIENAPEMMDSTENTVTQCVIKACDDGSTGTVTNVASCDILPGVVQCDIIEVAQCDISGVAQCDIMDVAQSDIASA